METRLEVTQGNSLKPFWETVQWSMKQYGNTIALTSKIRNIETTRMFQLTEKGESLENQKQYFSEQMQAAQNDLLTRLEFIYKVRHGMFDSIEELNVKWNQPQQSNSTNKIATYRRISPTQNK